MFSFLICSIGASSDSLVLDTNRGEVAIRCEEGEVKVSSTKCEGGKAGVSTRSEEGDVKVSLKCDEDGKNEVSNKEGKGDEEGATLAELSFKCTFLRCLTTLALVANCLPQESKVHVKTTGETCRATCRL